jgi:hypothetical protein
MVPIIPISIGILTVALWFSFLASLARDWIESLKVFLGAGTAVMTAVLTWMLVFDVGMSFVGW